MDVTRKEQLKSMRGKSEPIIRDLSSRGILAPKIQKVSHSQSFVVSLLTKGEFHSFTAALEQEPDS